MPSSRKHKRRRSIWQICVPLLLIGLLLYNPFLVLVSHTGGLAYQELARHRATVGASELQHFSPMQGESAQPETIVEEVFAAAVITASESPIQVSLEEVLPPRPEGIGSIWFRPPPTA